VQYQRLKLRRRNESQGRLLVRLGPPPYNFNQEEVT
jgi:hypothetical protein